jgi:hypothetical protein
VEFSDHLRLRARDDEHYSVDGKSRLELKPGESTTLTFQVVIQLQEDDDDEGESKLTITPIKGNVYSIRLIGDGSQTFQVTAS